MRPLGATADRATARLGPSLHIKAKLPEVKICSSKFNRRPRAADERKLTVGASAKVTADILP